MIRVRPVMADDISWKAESLRRAWSGTAVARKGEVVDALTLDGLVALDDGDRVGLLTYALHGDEFEVVTIQVSSEGVGGPDGRCPSPG